MLCYPEAGEFTPLFVVGMPRAGTRFMTDALNLSSEVAIQGEVFAETIETVRQLFLDLDPRLDWRGRSEDWGLRKQHLLTAVWTNTAKSAPVPMSEGCRFFGFKSPHHERFFDFYEEMFTDDPPIWVFNVRNFRGLFRSLSSMTWRKGVKATIPYIGAEYLRAMDELDHMLASAPDRVIPFVLDNYQEDQEGYLTGILERIGIRHDPGLVTKMIGLGARNSARSKGIDKKDLTPEDERWVGAHLEVDERFAAIASVY